MDVREKLVELKKVLRECLHFNYDEFSCDMSLDVDLTAENLIAHGVTVQEWIPVKDRLPEQGQEVIVYSGGVLKPTVFAYQFWNKNYDSWARITHWMPLPQPPKGE